jgi:hypothetical protein
MPILPEESKRRISASRLAGKQHDALLAIRSKANEAIDPILDSVDNGVFIEEIISICDRMIDLWSRFMRGGEEDEGRTDLPDGRPEPEHDEGDGYPSGLASQSPSDSDQETPLAP